ncbi:MAG: stage II sporulation protein R [Oscillospiraceae bacterium]|jgi:stage II sporulation protein R|nr:stage II sporulation protein R [Oscillospiraceae bacterium]
MFRNLHSPKEHRQRHAKLLRRLALLALCAFLGSLLSFHLRCAGIRQEVLRLHVIAHSDSEADQSAKLAVRDAILREGATLFDGSVTAAQAQTAVLPRKEALETCARRVLRARGLDYSVQVSVGVEYFNTRSYEDITLPAGRYQALRVILGEGKGRNWWCVMFPPLCLPAAEKKDAVRLDAVLSGGELRVVKSNPRFEVRFKLVELWEEFWAKRKGKG